MLSKLMRCHRFFVDALSIRLSAVSLVAALAGLAASGVRAAEGPDFQQPDPKLFPDLFVWTDTCNVYVLRQGDAALLIDLGDGSVLEHLPKLGIQRVEWVLFTHHHREQCQGAPKLAGTAARIGAPEAERTLFEKPLDYRKLDVRLGDAFTIHGSSYVRPPIQPIRIDRAFSKLDSFAWHGLEFTCLETRGNSPGGMSYLLRREGRWIAFSGDAMLARGMLHTWFDSEWDYGFGAGIYALHNAAGQLAGYDPAWLFPSHGPSIEKPRPTIERFQRKLREFEKLYLRGYAVNTFAGGYQDKVSRPTAVPQLWQVTPHLYKFKGNDMWSNFAILVADSGRALVVDCGLLDEKMLQRTLESMKEKLGLRGIDAVVVTHMHGDHFLEVPFLREQWGAKVWGLDRMAAVCEHPEWFDYAAPGQAYGKKDLTGLKFDRLFKSGEQFSWEGHTFTVDWMPGQTEFALCLRGLIDGRKVAFTGDNLFGDPDDPEQNGHEAVVAHNSAIFEEGYILGAERLRSWRPDLLVGGHSFVMDRPAKFIERFRKWSYAMRDAFAELLVDKDYRYGFDPFWVRAEPYRLRIKPGGETLTSVSVRNFTGAVQRHRIELVPPPGLEVEPKIIEGRLAGGARGQFPIRVRAVARAQSGVHLVAIDVTLDQRRFGQWFDFVVGVPPGNP